MTSWAEAIPRSGDRAPMTRPREPRSHIRVSSHSSHRRDTCELRARTNNRNNILRARLLHTTPDLHTRTPIIRLRAGQRRALPLARRCPATERPSQPCTSHLAWSSRSVVHMHTRPKSQNTEHPASVHAHVAQKTPLPIHPQSCCVPYRGWPPRPTSRARPSMASLVCQD